jgi:hypothetical protein
MSWEAFESRGFPHRDFWLGSWGTSAVWALSIQVSCLRQRNRYTIEPVSLGQ